MSLKEKIAELPTTPGVYLMKDRRGIVIYVGKAKSLRSRVASYFQAGQSDTRPKIPQMIAQVHDVQVVETESEVDALLMEARLIKDVQPRFNQDLRDGKLYPYLEITRGDDFPGVYVTRYTDNRRSKYFGPFTDTRGLRRSVQIMQRVFRFRTCAMEIDAGDARRRFNRPCLLYYIDSCHAPCADLISRQEYRETVSLLVRFLEGKRKRVLAGLTRRMQDHADGLEYEKAARVRDQIKALDALSKRAAFDEFPEAGVPPVVELADGLAELQQVLGLPTTPRTIEGIDVAHIGGAEAVGSLVSFVDGKPFKAGYRRFRIKTVAGVDDYAMIAEIVARRFRRLLREESIAPDIFLVDGGLGHIRAALGTLREICVEAPAVVSLAKKQELVYTSDHGPPLRLKRNQPALRLLQYVRDEAHRFAQHYHHLLRHKAVLREQELKVKRKT